MVVLVVLGVGGVGAGDDVGFGGFWVGGFGVGVASGAGDDGSGCGVGVDDGGGGGAGNNDGCGGGGGVGRGGYCGGCDSRCSGSGGIIQAFVHLLKYIFSPQLRPT